MSDGGRNTLILKYNERREAFVKLSFYVFAVILLIVTFSRARMYEETVVEKSKPAMAQTEKVPKGFSLKLPFTDDFEFNNGDIIVFGPLLIFAMVLWFDKSFLNLLKMKRAIEGTFNNSEATLTPVEKHLLEEPFHYETESLPVQWIKKRESLCKFLIGIPPRAVYILALIAVFSLLTEYFQFRPKENGAWWNTVFGIPPFTDGFDPYWKRFPKMDVTWIYPPWYTIAYLCIMAFMSWRVWKPPGKSGN